jgi:ERCC4-type nuclease
MGCSDFAVYYMGNLLFVVERKAWSDLAASIKDGRINDQVAKMTSLDVKIKKFIIVEGPIRGEYNGISFSNLIKKLDHIMFQHPIHVMYSSSPLGTCKRILQLVDNFPLDFGQYVEQKERDTVLQAINFDSTEKTMAELFAAIKGIGHNTARLLMENGWSVMDLYTSTPEILSEMIYPLSGATVGITKARKIFEALGTKACWVAILSAVNGITKRTAEEILTKSPNVLDWTEFNLQDLDIPHGAKLRKLGALKAQKILKFLNLKIQKKKDPL